MSVDPSLASDPARPASAAPLPLGYGHPRMSRRRRIWLTTLVVLSILLSAALMHWRRPLTLKWNATRAAYWRDQCANLERPGDMLVYEEDPQRVGALLKTGKFVPCDSAFGPNTVYRPIKALDRYLAVPGTHSMWSYYAGLLAKHPVLFCHEMQRSDGSKRIVLAVYEQQTNRNNRRFAYVRVMECDRKDFFNNLVSQTWEAFVFRDESSEVTNVAAESIRFYAGELVKDDPYSFVIKYQLGEEWGTLKFKLNGDAAFDRTIDGPRPIGYHVAQ